MTDNLRWLVVATEHRAETLAEQNAAEAGFPTFLPLQRSKAGNIDWMYSGYLFVRTDPYRDQAWAPLLELEGVEDVLRNAGGSSPWCMPVANWQVLRMLTSPYGVFDPWPRPKRQTHGFKRGDLVRIVDGIWADPHGTMERYGTVEWTDKDTLALSGACFNGSGTIRVPASQVELAPEGQGARLDSGAEERSRTRRRLRHPSAA